MTPRKHIRIAMNPDDIKNLERAKKAAEEATGIAMSDSMFALSVIRKAIAKPDDTA